MLITKLINLDIQIKVVFLDIMTLTFITLSACQETVNIKHWKTAFATIFIIRMVHVTTCMWMELLINGCSAHCFGFMTRTFTVMVHSHCSVLIAGAAGSCLGTYIEYTTCQHQAGSCCQSKTSVYATSLAPNSRKTKVSNYQEHESNWMLILLCVNRQLSADKFIILIL